MNDLHQLASSAREAFYRLSAASLETRNKALLNLAELLTSHKKEIFAENRSDLSAAEATGLAAPLLHRLKFGEQKITQVTEGLRALSDLPDPIGTTTYAKELLSGLKVYRVVCPIGVIGVIFESRPDALIQIASLCIKSGNAVLLKGGSEALHTNMILCRMVREALESAGLPKDAAQLLESREDVSAMLKEDALIDLIIPRGSNQFVRYIKDNSRIPVLGHADGICHVYIDNEADIPMAIQVAVDSKTQNVSVCNAMETLLVHQDIAKDVLPPLCSELRNKGVSLCADETVRRIVDCELAAEDDWSMEYLDYRLSIKTVSSLSEAIEHINHYGSHHTDCIVTANEAHAALFMKLVDSAGTYWNASTRFADGFVYGFGAEVGIATGKIHARGPMGLEGLTTYKYKLIGNGHTLAGVKDSNLSYTHVSLNENCPL